MAGLTRAAMRALAKRARRDGYTQDGATLAVTCPQCHRRVETQADPGRVHTRTLDAAMVRHLTGGCGLNV